MTDYLQGTSILLHGAAKVGKTQFCATFPKPILYYAAESGHRYVKDMDDVHVHKIYKSKEWPNFVKHITTDFKTIKPKTVVIDTTNTIYLTCQRWVCEQNRIKTPSDLPHGAGWSKVYAEFLDAISALMDAVESINATVIFITHTTSEDIAYRTCTISRQSYVLGGQPERIVAANVDNIWFMDFPTDTEREMCDYRVLWLKGNANVRAETRDPTLRYGRIKKLKPGIGYRQVEAAFRKSRESPSTKETE
jgi:hypothetical protein